MSDVAPIDDGSNLDTVAEESAPVDAIAPSPPPPEHETQGAYP